MAECLHVRLGSGCDRSQVALGHSRPGYQDVIGSGTIVLQRTLLNRVLLYSLKNQEQIE